LLVDSFGPHRVLDRERDLLLTSRTQSTNPGFRAGSLARRWKSTEARSSKDATMMIAIIFMIALCFPLPSSPCAFLYLRTLPPTMPSVHSTPEREPNRRSEVRVLMMSPTSAYSNSLRPDSELAADTPDFDLMWEYAKESGIQLSIWSDHWDAKEKSAMTALEEIEAAGTAIDESGSRSPSERRRSETQGHQWQDPRARAQAAFLAAEKQGGPDAQTLRRVPALPQHHEAARQDGIQRNSRSIQSRERPENSMPQLH